MSLTDTLYGIIDNVGLRDVFHRKETDLASLRRPLLKGIERTRTQFARAAKGPNRWWTVKNGVVALTVTVAGDTFDINGVTTNHMPEDRFPEFLDHFRDAVSAGEFDAELINHGEGTAEVHTPSSARAALVRQRPRHAAPRRPPAARPTARRAKASRQAEWHRFTLPLRASRAMCGGKVSSADATDRAQAALSPVNAR